MSRFLKLIVSLMLIVFILAGVGLIVPQFLGIDVVVVQETNAGNQKVGTAIYTQKKDVAVLAPGEKILDLGTNTLNVFTVVGYDPTTGVVDVTGGSLESLLVSRTWLKVLAAVPYIGLLSIATQSTNGLIFLGVLLGVVILLFIFSEILRRGDDDDYDDDDDDFYRDLVEKKRSAEQADEEERLKKKDRRSRKRGRKKAVEEEYDEPYEEEADVPDITRIMPADAGRRAQKEDSYREDSYSEDPYREDSYTDRGLTEIREEAPRRTAEGAYRDEPSGREEDPDEGRGFGMDSLPDVQAALEAALENQPLNRAEDTQIPETAEPEPVQEEYEPAGEIELAMPVRTAEEILQQAYAAGQDPKVREEGITGVTLVDFSDSL